MKRLSELEAFAAMFAFLAHWYEMTQSDDVGGLLGSMFLLPDGGTADPAVWEDWLEAVTKAKAGSVDLGLKLKRADDSAKL